MDFWQAQGDEATLDAAWEMAEVTRVEMQWGGVPIFFISLSDLIRNKEAANRDTDKTHLSRLRKYGKE